MGSSDNSVTDLVTAFVNAVLFAREVYPSKAFQAPVTDIIPLKKCVHPEIVAYIDEYSERIRLIVDTSIAMRKKETRSTDEIFSWAISLSILEKSGQLLEQFVLEVKYNWNLLRGDGSKMQKEIIRDLTSAILFSDQRLGPQTQAETFSLNLHVPEEISLQLASTSACESKWCDLTEAVSHLEDGCIVPIYSHHKFKIACFVIRHRDPLQTV